MLHFFPRVCWVLFGRSETLTHNAEGDPSIRIPRLPSTSFFIRWVKPAIEPRVDCLAMQAHGGTVGCHAWWQVCLASSVPERPVSSLAPIHQSSSRHPSIEKIYLLLLIIDAVFNLSRHFGYLFL